MTRSRWAILGLSALALLAMTAVIANGAQAEGGAGEFTCLNDHEEPTSHEGCTAHGNNIAIHREHNNGFSSVHTFSAGFATLTCKETTFNVTTDANGTNPAPKVEPIYNKCEADPGNLQAHVDTNGCEYEFHANATSEKTTEKDEYVGTASIVGCDAESGGITVTITTGEFKEPTNEAAGTRCLIHIPEQPGIGPVYFRNVTNASPQTDMEVEAATAEADGIFTGGFFNCGASENAVTRYTGNATVQAENHDSEPIDLHVD